MTNRHNLVALDWIKHEVNLSLNTAISAIEVFLENNQDTAPLIECEHAIKQVHGTLKVVELNGATLFLEHLANAVNQLALKKNSRKHRKPRNQPDT